MMAAEAYKMAAALAALEYVADGMKVGIGTGSTADHFNRALGAAVEDGLKVIGKGTLKGSNTLKHIKGALKGSDPFH